jgi:hypothetical protein
MDVCEKRAFPKLLRLRHVSIECSLHLHEALFPRPVRVLILVKDQVGHVADDIIVVFVLVAFSLWLRRSIVSLGLLIVLHHGVADSLNLLLHASLWESC